MRPLVLIALALGASAALAATGLTADDAVTAALSRSPDVTAAEAAVEAARGQLGEDGALLANPEFDAQVSATTPKFDLDVSQAVSLAGEGWHARAADRAALQAAEHDRDRARLVVAHDAREAWAEAVLSAEREAVAREDLDLAGRLRGATAARHEAGAASDLDVRLSRLTEASAASAWLSARAEEDEARATLVALAGVGAVVADADPLSAAPPASGGTQARSDVAAAEARVQAAEAALRRARAAALPALQLGAFVERDGADLSVGPSFGLEVPLWTRNQAERAAASGEVVVGRAEAAQAEVVADEETRRARALAGDAEGVARLGSGALLDDARAALGEVEKGYAAGALTLPDAIELRREILEGQAGVLELAGQVVDARLALLLATEDPALLPPGAR